MTATRHLAKRFALGEASRAVSASERAPPWAVIQPCVALGLMLGQADWRLSWSRVPPRQV